MRVSDTQEWRIPSAISGWVAIEDIGAVKFGVEVPDHFNLARVGRGPEAGDIGKVFGG